MRPITLLRARLEAAGCRPRGPDHRFTSRCPAHDDHRPSLSVGENASGDALAYCHASCTLEEILAALGLTLADLFNDDRGAPMREIESYPYTDEQGGRLFEVVRFEPKSFRQRRADGTWGLGDTRRVLFRLPEVRSACDQGRTVFVVEGERDVLALEQLGLTATSPAMGAGKWRAEYCESLRGAGRIVVLPDADEVGRDHAEVVARSLHARGLPVRVLDLHPDANGGLDVRDWLREHTAGDLKALVAAASPFVPTVAEGRGEERRGKRAETQERRRVVALSAAEVEAHRVEWLLPGRVPLGAVTLLLGLPGRGKSLWAMLLAALLTRGELPCGPAAALFASFEDARSFVLRPRAEAAGADLGRVHFLATRDEDGEGGIELPTDVDSLAEAIRETDARLIVIDPLVAAVPVELNTHRDQHVRRALAPLARVAEETGCAIVVVVHTNKAPGADAILRTGGSIAIPAAARSALLLVEDPEDETARLLGHFKCNVARLAPTLRLRIETRPVEVAGGVEATPMFVDLGTTEHDGRELLALVRAENEDERGARDEAKSFLLEELYAGPRPTRDIERDARALGIHHETLKRARKALGIVAEPVRNAAGKTVAWQLRLPLLGGIEEASKTRGSPSSSEPFSTGGEPLDKPQYSCGFVARLPHPGVQDTGGEPLDETLDGSDPLAEALIETSESTPSGQVECLVCGERCAANDLTCPACRARQEAAEGGEG